MNSMQSDIYIMIDKEVEVLLKPGPIYIPIHITKQLSSMADSLDMAGGKPGINASLDPLPHSRS
jgi:hypothetical protein